ncbi:MAG TPA: hypothetical protein VGH27_04335 [Streptosporangiaceae bacterium]|jgi:hypothetical protein
MTEFASLAESAAGGLKDAGVSLAKELNKTFNGNQKQSFDVSFEAISTLGTLPEQQVYKFDWETKATKEYTGGYISWIRLKKLTGSSGSTAVYKENTARAKGAEAKEISTRSGLDAKLAAKNQAEFVKIVDGDIERYIAAYYTKKILAKQSEYQIKLRAARLPPQDTGKKLARAKPTGSEMEERKQLAHTRASGGLGTAIKELCRKRGVDLNEPIKQAIAGLLDDKSQAEVVAKGIAAQMKAGNTPVLTAKYTKYQQAYLEEQQIRRYATQKDINPEEVKADPEMLSKVKNKALTLRLADYEKDFMVSSVTGFSVHYTIVGVDEGRTEERWDRLKDLVEADKLKELQKIDDQIHDITKSAAKLEEIKNANIKARLEKGIEDRLTKMDELRTKTEELWNRHLARVETEHERVNAIIKKPAFAQRIGEFRIDPVATVGGLASRVHSLDSNVNLGIKVSSTQDGNVRVHVDFVETAQGLADKIPGGTVQATGDLTFRGDGTVLADGDFAKQWKTNSNV